MKKIIYSILSFSLIWLVACEQVPIVPEEVPVVETPTCPADATAGPNLTFTKFVAVGNSFVAGVQGGALFTSGQNNSLAAILNKQFECVGAPATFNQPTIGASLGWNLFVTQPFLSDNTKPILGRMLLQYSGATSPKPTPQPYAVGNLEALPNPAVNPGFIYGDGSTKAALNNFGVPAIFLGQALITETGNWGAPTHPYFSPFYARMEYPGDGSKRLLTDAAGAGGSFFFMWLGMDDFLLHAAFGANTDGSTPASTRPPLTNAVGGTAADFDYQYTAAVTIMLTNPAMKGVVANFPDIFVMPHFTSVTYNPIPLDATNANALTNGFAGYNAAVEGLKAFGGAYGTATELDARKVTFITGNNKILLKDEYIPSLAAGFDALLNAAAITPEQRAALVPYEQVRQTTSADVIPLSTGGILGTTGTFGLLGLSEPVGDRWVITPTEKTQINNARTAYNGIISSIVNANSTKLALADVSAAMASFGPARVLNNVTLTPNINPPTGIYSEDGIHPNSRGYAYISKVVIDAINLKFGSKIPVTNMAKYSATALPIP